MLIYIKPKINSQLIIFPTPENFYQFLSYTWTIPHIDRPYHHLFPLSPTHTLTHRIIIFPTYHNHSSTRITILTSCNHFIVNSEELTYTYSKTISPGACGEISTLNICIPADLMHTTTSSNWIISLLQNREPSAFYNYISLQNKPPYKVPLNNFTYLSMSQMITAQNLTLKLILIIIMVSTTEAS